MVKPVELIAKARRRLALVAAAGEAALWAVPAMTGIILAAALGPIGRSSWERFGYELSDPAMFAIRAVLLAIGVGAMFAGAIRAWLAATRTGFVDAAARVDEVVGGHEEVLTLATLSEPGRADAEARGALFPMLWRRVTSLLEAFDPDSAFSLEVAAPLRRSSVVALPVVLGLALATLALMRPPTPMRIQARKLLDLADTIAAEPGGEGLAKQVAAVAKDLQDPDIPPQEKMRKLSELMNRVDNQQRQEAETPPDKNKPANGPDKKQMMASASGTGSGNGGGTSKGQSAGSAGNASSGKGDSGGGQGQTAGKGDEAGKGSGAEKGEGTGSEASASTSSKNGNRKGANPGDSKGLRNQRMMDLQKQLAKAQEQVQMEGSKNPGPKTASGGNDAGNGPKPGSDQKNQQLASNQNNSAGQGGKPGGTTGQGPKPGTGPSPAGANKVPGGSQGDTHLGEMPAPVRFERFYKPGETGPVLNIRDARFVLFRLPTAIPGAAGGKLSIDKGGVHATTPYVNVPLNEAHLEVAPDERQLVPPRYRELIH